VAKNLIVNFDDVLFRESGTVPRPGSVRLMKDAEAAHWNIALTSTLEQRVVRERLSEFLPSLAEHVMIVGSDSWGQGESPVEIASANLRSMPEQTLVLERDIPGYERAVAADLAMVVMMDSLPMSADIEHARLVVDRFGLPDDEDPVAVWADPLNLRPHPMVTVEHLEACLPAFSRKMDELGYIKEGDVGPE